MINAADADGEAWFEQAFSDDPEARALSVNEGDLVILETPPSVPTHQHMNTLTILPSSLLDGWTELLQCHSHLDRVPALQIVYSSDRIADLAITRQRNIGKAAVQGHTVQLENIRADSEICIKARTRALHKTGNGFVLRNGPYMRRFLDGYYPMRVRLAVRYPETLLKFESASPVAVRAGDIAPGYAEIDVWFEGRLSTELLFSTLQ